MITAGFGDCDSPSYIQAARFCAARVTTVFVRQRQYAIDPEALAGHPAADLSIARVGDLLKYKTAQFLGSKK
jgi:hypothetical protein